MLGRTEGRAGPVILSAKGPGGVGEFVAVAGKGCSCPAWGAGEVVSQSRTRPFLWGQPGNGLATAEGWAPGRVFPWCLGSSPLAQLPGR